MRHRAKHKQLGRTSEHRRALLSNMATSLFKHGKVTRIVRLGHRVGDGAETARIELLAE
jgi:ribosomal protein L17